MRISAIVIARKNSVRLKRKMYQKFFGLSLIEHKIRQLLKTNVNNIFIGSDDSKLNKICKKYGKKVIFVKREKKFCDEKSTTPNEMIKNILGMIDTDLVLWAHPTNPLTNQNHYNNALKTFLKLNKKKFDSLFSVTKQMGYFWDMNKKPLNHNPNEKSHTLLSSNKIKPIFSDNGAIFIREYKDMLRDGRFWGDKGYMYIMDEKSAWDINNLWDLDACQLPSFEK